MAKKDDFEVQQKFIELRASGKTFSFIAEALGVSKRSLISWSNEFGDVIGNLKRIEMEGLVEQYVLSKQVKMEMFKGFLDKAKAEFSKRDCSDISTDKLFDMIVKLVGVLEQEGIVFREKESFTDFDLMTAGKVKEWES